MHSASECFKWWRVLKIISLEEINFELSTDRLGKGRKLTKTVAICYI